MFNAKTFAKKTIQEMPSIHFRHHSGGASCAASVMFFGSNGKQISSASAKPQGVPVP